MSIMKPGKKKGSSEKMKSILQGVQPQGKISHWKKLRLKRKLKKRKTLQSALQVQGKNTLQAQHPATKHKPHKSGMKAKKRMGAVTVKESKNINCEKNVDAGNSEVKTSFRQTVKNGTVKHISNKLRKQKQKRMKKGKEKHLPTEKGIEAVMKRDSSTDVIKVASESSWAKDSVPINVIKLPVLPAEVSSNWKKLQSTLPPKRKRARSPPSKHGRLETSTTDGKEKKPEAAKEEIWFDDVDEILIEKRLQHSRKESSNTLILPNASTDLTKALAMDCEMVGVGKGGEESVLARVSLVNQHGHCVYDKFVRPREKVTDFRTQFSGVRPANLRSAEDFLVVQKEVSDLLKGRLLVGHALYNDLKVLFLDHSRKLIRDTARYKPFQQLMGTNRPSLKKLTAKVLGVSVQEGEHSSVQDAQAAMRLYTMHRKRWEQELKSRKHKKLSS